MRGREIMEKEGSAIERYIRSTSDILPKGKHMRSIADIKELSALLRGHKRCRVCKCLHFFLVRKREIGSAGHSKNRS
jgi:hypothetical protein